MTRTDPVSICQITATIQIRSVLNDPNRSCTIDPSTEKKLGDPDIRAQNLNRARWEFGFSGIRKNSNSGMELPEVPLMDSTVMCSQSQPHAAPAPHAAPVGTFAFAVTPRNPVLAAAKHKWQQNYVVQGAIQARPAPLHSLLRRQCRGPSPPWLDRVGCGKNRPSRRGK